MMDTTQLARWLAPGRQNKNALIGLDGFVDRVLRVVEKRTDRNSARFVQTLDDYGRKISAAAGLSLNVELLPTSRQLGGNGPLMAKAIARLGTDTGCIGCFGYPDMASEFAPLARLAALYSVEDHASTDDYEFHDGKIIASVVEPLNRLTCEDILSRVGTDTLTRLLADADLIALNNWTMLPCMTRFWQLLQQDFLPGLPQKDRVFFIDLADPAKRTVEDLSQALHTLTGFSPYGRVLLSCNKREALQLAGCLGLDTALPLGELAAGISQTLRLWCVAIHTLTGSHAWVDGRILEAPGFYVEKPFISIGGGDHFNAGLAYGIMQDLPVQDALLLASAVSGYFVRTGASPDREQLAEFLRKGGAAYEL